MFCINCSFTYFSKRSFFTINAYHTQKQHDEILVIIEGNVDFQSWQRSKESEYRRSSIHSTKHVTWPNARGRANALFHAVGIGVI